ncbi:unnamed protein product [Cylindrotheca closterium]|uniref:alpha-1,2-Mannosidase n=1 Tax=Cylindrotheca closterium TaxID=2856 RepID=A0AAD2FC24_9STRA|nr:unnamed protein product [Cylindrotheca closterium]
MPPLPQSRVKSNRILIKDMFEHAYDSYMYNAYPASEIKPMTCKPAVFNLVRIPALTLIDSLDTLVILGNYTEFARSVERLRELNDFMDSKTGESGKGGIFALNQNVSVFETNIRILGGLLSAHQLAEAFLSDKVIRADVWDSTGAILVGNDRTLVCERNYDAQEIDDSHRFVSSIPRCTTQLIRGATCQDQSNMYWEYDGFFLKLAQDIGDRLLPAYATHTGIPYGTVNLLSGIPLDETTIASLAGGGTLSLEMELLSRLTGNMEYGKAAKLAARALWVRSSQFNTFGKHICTQRGQWTESLSGIGSNSDSFYEYLVKHYVLFPEDHGFWHSALSAYGGVHNESRLGDWYADVDLTRGLSTNGVARRIFEALMAFYPGMQVLLGEIVPAARSLNSFFLVREYLGFLPERFDYGNWKVDGGGGSHFLRPELIESAYFLHRATKGLQRPQMSMSASSWQWAADYALQALDKITRSNCGFASLRETAPWSTGAAALGSPASAELIDDMPSFFLSETLKYLYLTFDDDNIIHDDEDRDWIFTTEAHPIHHADVSNNEEKLSRLENRKKELIRRLRSRLAGYPDSQDFRWDGLDREKWAIGTSLEAFAQKLYPFVSEENENAAHRRNNTEAALTEPILSIDHVYRGLDVFGETQNGLNDAHLMLRRNGNGVALAKSCPNFYSSELLYINALNGGGTDYTTSYVSTLRDAVHPGESRFLMMGSIDALAWYGFGVHVIEAFDPTSFCVVEYLENQPPAAGSSDEKQKEVVSQRFDGGDLGNFEILAFDGGAGFSIKHIGSGQSLATTIIQDAASIQSGDKYFMVDHRIPYLKETEVRESDVVHHSDTEAHRSVVMTDNRSNSYVCVVEIIETTHVLGEYPIDQRYVDTPTTGGRESMRTVLARYPCAPALFGVTHPNNLASTSEIRVEAQLVTPKQGDKAGCKDSTDQSCSTDEQDHCGHPTMFNRSSRIQLVQRGSCTFQDKSRNQVGAEAVIVINSKEEELFVMSGNSDQIESELFDSPLTVLVSGADGLDMIEKTETFSEERNSRTTADICIQRSCMVSVTRENTKVTNDGNDFTVMGNQFWPAVVASPDAIQVFVEDGWGVHAAQKSNAGPGPVEWQLYLLRFYNGQENSDVAEIDEIS